MVICVYVSFDDARQYSHVDDIISENTTGKANLIHFVFSHFLLNSVEYSDTYILLNEGFNFKISDGQFRWRWTLPKVMGENIESPIWEIMNFAMKSRYPEYIRIYEKSVKWPVTLNLKVNRSVGVGSSVGWAPAGLYLCVRKRSVRPSLRPADSKKFPSVRN